MGTNDIKNSGYVVQLPLVGGTVIGYSPALMTWGEDEDDLIGDEGEGGARKKFVAVHDVEAAEFPVGRQKEDEVLFRILWDGHSSTASSSSSSTTTTMPTTNTVGYIEDITLPELLSCIINPPENLTSKQRLQHKKSLHSPYNMSSMPTSEPLTVLPKTLLTQTSASIIKHVHATTCRKQLGLEWKLEYDILPHLVTLAALELRKELALKVRLDVLMERKRLRLESGLDKQNVNGKSGKGGGGEEEKEVVNSCGTNFRYYTKHPNQYMSSFQAPPPDVIDEDDDDDSDNEDEDGSSDDKPKRSKTKLSKAELITYHTQLTEQCNVAPSKIADRVKLACSMAYEYVSANGMLDEYYAECERRKERERDEKERMAGDVGGRSATNNRYTQGGGLDGTGVAIGEVRRSSRARTTVVNYADEYAPLDDHDMRGDDNGGGKSTLTNGRTVPRENVVGGPTALYLLEMLKMLPSSDEGEKKKGDEKEEMDENDDEDVKMGDEDNDDDDEEEEDKGDTNDEDSPENDPFFEPNPCLIIDQLGRKHRYLSPASIQQSIVRSIEAHQIHTPKYLLDEEEANDGHYHVTDLACTTGDKVSDLGQFEPSSFSRCRFAPRTIIPETDEEDEVDHEGIEEDVTPEELEARRIASEASKQRKLQRRLDKKVALQKRNAELERAYRSQKAFELWRFRSVHGDGCTIFPTWRECSLEILKDVFDGNQEEAAAAAAAVPSSTASGAVEAAQSYSATLPDTASSNVVASVEESAAQASMHTTNEAALPPPAAATSASVPTSSVQNDEELARSLAAAPEGTEDDNLPLAKRRRTTRRAAASGAGIEPVFYGGHTSMSRDQLLYTLVRLLHQAKPGSSSLMDMKQLIFPENYDHSRGGIVEMKKIRSALGHLVYRLGKVHRLIVDVTKGDGMCLALLKDGPLVKFVGNIDNDNNGETAIVATTTAMDAEVPSPSLKSEEITKSEEKLPTDNVASNDSGGITADAPSAVASSSTTLAALPDDPPAPPLMDEHLKTKLLALETYISNLHRTELSLRKSLMKVIDKGLQSKESNGTLLQISTLAIATAADEVEGMADAEDWKYFKSDENGTEYKWSKGTNAHVLIGQVLYRPQDSPLRQSQETAGNDVTTLVDAKCHWYRIVSYTPSVKATVEETTSRVGNPMSSVEIGKKDAPRENTIVERRMRFRAMPIAESDIELPYHRMDTDDDGEDDIEFMVLTEGQARAGIEAALLKRKLENTPKKKFNMPPGVANLSPVGAHPYRNRHGSRVTLTPQTKEGEGKEVKDILYGIVTGYDIVSEEDGKGGVVIKNKVLLLLEEDGDDDNEDAINKLEEGSELVNNGNEKKSRVAFWSTVKESAEGKFISDIVPTADEADGSSSVPPLPYSTYDIDMNEYHQGSEAYDACVSIVSYLKNHSRSGPFLTPVDHVALNILDYPTKIKEPMDISTLEKNLEDGKYGGNHIKYSFGDDADPEDWKENPIYKMVLGPFFYHATLMFENCIQYNGEEAWIGNEASILKKNLEKKIDQVLKKAVGTSSAKSSGRPSAGAKKSIYAEEDSDVDMYEYESDYDDEDGGGKRRSRKGRNKPRKKRAGKEDIPSKAIEQPFMMPENGHEFGSGLGAFPHLKVQTSVGKFALSQGWSCRYMKKINEGNTDTDKEVEKKESEDDEMLLLMQMQQQELEGSNGDVRRSSRARHAPQNYADENEYAAGVPAVSSAPQAPVTLPGVEYHMTNDEVFQTKRGIDGEINPNYAADSSIPTSCRSRLSIEGIQETIHEQFHATLYREHSHNALILNSGLGKYADGSFPPYLGRVLPAATSNDDDAIVWEIREQYLIPALRWVLRGLVRSGHLQEVDGSLSEGVTDDAPTMNSFGSGIVVPSHEYYYNETFAPYDIVDEKEISRKRRLDAAADADSSSEEEVELSEYEKMRAERVQRNAERLKALGLA